MSIIWKDGHILWDSSHIAHNTACCCHGGGCLDKPFCYMCGGAPGATPAYIDIEVSGFPDDPSTGPLTSCFCRFFNGSFRLWFVEGANITMTDPSGATQCLFITADWQPLLDPRFPAGLNKNCIAWSIYQQTSTPNKWVLDAVMNPEGSSTTGTAVRFDLGDMDCSFSGTFTATPTSFGGQACVTPSTVTATLTPGPPMTVASLDKNLVADFTSPNCTAFDGLSVPLTYGTYTSDPDPHIPTFGFYRGTFTCGGVLHRVDFSCPSGFGGLQWPIYPGGAIINGLYGSRMFIDYYDTGTSSWVNCATFNRGATPDFGPADRGTEPISLDPFLWTHACGANDGTAVATCCGCSAGIIYAEVTEAA